MTPAARDWLRRLGPIGRYGLLALSLAVALCIALPAAYGLQGMPACRAAMVAAGVVLLSSTLAMVISDFMRRSGQALASVLLGMAMRMFLPLGACVLAQLNPGALSEAGFVYFVLVFYLVALPTDTVLALVQVQPKKAA